MRIENHRSFIYFYISRIVETKFTLNDFLLGKALSIIENLLFDDGKSLFQFVQLFLVFI
jgi:hypothetical protein